MRQISIWQNGPVSDSQGRVANLLQSECADGDAPWEADFLAAEFAWMKDVGIRDEAHYLEVARVGRGVRLTKKERTTVWALFQRYEAKLRSQRRYDWGDVPVMALEALRESDVTAPAYHAILVDEAQDFAPTWFDVLRAVLHPDTRLMFVAADSTQSIYRRFSWKSMGLNVVGRTRILPNSYRSTYEVMQAASAMLTGNPDLLAEMRDEEEELLVPDLDPQWMRHGPIPELRQFPDRYEEIHYLARSIKHLLAQGYFPGDIVVLHRKKRLLDQYRSELRRLDIPVKLPNVDMPRQDGVDFATMHSAKGLEYRAVFIVQAQMLFDRPEQPIPFAQRPRFLADELRLLYVAMTRAREQLTITHQNRLAAEIQPLRTHLESIERTA